MAAHGGAHAYHRCRAVEQSAVPDAACCLLPPLLILPLMLLLAGGSGWVDVDESTDGILKVLESGQPLNGRFFGYNGEEIPW